MNREPEMNRKNVVTLDPKKIEKAWADRAFLNRLTAKQPTSPKEVAWACELTAKVSPTVYGSSTYGAVIEVVAPDGLHYRTAKSVAQLAASHAELAFAAADEAWSVEVQPSNTHRSMARVWVETTSGEIEEAERAKRLLVDVVKAVLA